MGMQLIFEYPDRPNELGQVIYSCTKPSVGETLERDGKIYRVTDLTWNMSLSPSRIRIHVKLELVKTTGTVKIIRWGKHNYYKDIDGEIDEMYFEFDTMNGPMCQVCGYSFLSCNGNEGYEDENCEWYICKECHRICSDSDKCKWCGVTFTDKEIKEIK